MPTAVTRRRTVNVLLKPEKAAPIIVFVDHHENEHDNERGDDEAQKTTTSWI